MARVFLSNETYNAATDNADILGAAGSEQVNVLAGTTGLNIASSVERVDLSGNIADYTFSSFGAAMTIRDSAGNIVGTVSDSGGKSVVFADGALSAVYAGTTLSLGGVALTGTAAAITPAAADIDATTTSDAAGAGTGGGTTTGVTRALTVDDDTFSGTSLNDTYTAAAGTLNSGDRIIDGSSSDNDSLVVTLTEDNVAPTISSIENINVDIDVFDGTTATLDASNISGATITMFSDRTLFNGTAEVDGLGDNNVTAGSNVDTLNVAGLEAGVVNTGSADTVKVTTAAATDVANLTVNGNLELELVTATDLVVTATSASVVTAAAGAFSATDVTLNGNVTLQSDADDITGDTITGGSLDINAATGGALDAGDFTVSSIEVSTDATLEISSANGQTINLTEANADLTVKGLAPAATEQSVTINVSADQATSNGISVIDFDSSTINLSAAVDELAVLTIEGDATLSVLSNVEVADLNKTAATDTVTVSGKGDVTLTDVDDVATVDSSALTGALDLTLTVDADIEVVAGSGDDSITLATVANVAAVSLGDGTNTLDASTVVAGTLNVIGGSGVDTVTLAVAPGASTIAMNGGAGNDIINFANGAIDITAATEWDVTGFTTFTVTDSETGATVGATLAADGSQLSGVTSISIAAADNGENDDTLAVTVSADEVTTDLSALVVADTDAITFTINGDDAVDDVITGTNGDDTIDGGKGADVLTGGAGADTFVFDASDSVETAMASITDFSLAEFDVLDNKNGVVAANKADTDVSTATTLGTDTISADLVDGIVTLGGADAANIDTLEEWLDAAQLVSTAAGAGTFGFEFGGNTYVVEDNGAGIDVVELVGVTGLEALDTAAGAFTLVIA